MHVGLRMMFLNNMLKLQSSNLPLTMALDTLQLYILFLELQSNLCAEETGNRQYWKNYDEDFFLSDHRPIHTFAGLARAFFYFHHNSLIKGF
jgi:hypothetical protein